VGIYINSSPHLSYLIYILSITFLLIYYNTMSGPPAGVKLSPAQIAAFKEAGVRNTFIVDLSAGFGPFIMGYVLPLYSSFPLHSFLDI
jgi:hypothetical protein